jgi:glycosidase
MRSVAAELGADRVARPVEGFVDLFPPVQVSVGSEDALSYLAKDDQGEPHTHLVARELILLHLAMGNRALKPFVTLFDDRELQKRTQYRTLVDAFDRFFDQQPGVSPLDLPLVKCLRAPMDHSPDSLEGQLEFIRERWAKLLPPWLLKRLLRARDALREETQQRGFGKDAIEVLGVGRGLGGYDYPEPERFSPDLDWMANVVLLAKNAYVWLDQLSRKYQRHCWRLDQVPDEELDALARWGFTGLWLIGLWERSVASEDIKKRMGNPEAAASAYSLYDYQIAGALGGEEAYWALKDRAWQRGIRLASDMVPNHVGLHSRWVIEHPDWFIQDSHPPFPSYQFNGPDLCPDDRVGIFVEDGYWSHSDAAVVFKRVDYWSGDTRYIYHGNDGTSMPWNDTAQLNYLLPQVREAVIQTILHVARLSPIIRFDAAMTLAKKHFQRLWFPLPGEGGAIPARSMYSMTREEFDQAFPEEFWREVVDRVQQEAPDTLLLAEAFWLMEGYFVRTLGMHRVYNSAFMNMLKMEENLKYRMTIKNVLEFSPQILKRFVNFMNNPDEDTAVAQFGKGDKYYGVAVLLATMPGLPMFGHGQVEGFTEKYGMEYRRAYWDEPIDWEVVNRHEREVFPLLRRRWLFSGSENFAFYDFIHPDGWVNENVFAYSNRAGGERALVVYNNAYQDATGRIHTSTAVNVGAVEDKHLRHFTLAEALALRTEPAFYYTFRDYRSGLSFIRSGEELAREGMFCALNGYAFQVFLDWTEVRDTDHSWRSLAEHLQGRGAYDLDRTRRELLLAPVLETFREVLKPATITALGRACATDWEARTAADGATREVRRVEKSMAMCLDILRVHAGVAFDTAETMTSIAALLESVRGLAARLDAVDESGALGREIGACLPESPSDPAFWRIPLVWALVRPLEEVLAVDALSVHSAQWLDDWLLTLPIQELFEALGFTADAAHEDAHLMMVLAHHTGVLLTVREDETAYLLEEFLEDPVARDYLRVNEYQGVLYIGKEPLERALAWGVFTGAAATLADRDLPQAAALEIIRSRVRCVRAVLQAAETSGYRLRDMTARLPGGAPAKKTSSSRKPSAKKKRTAKQKAAAGDGSSAKSTASAKRKAATRKKPATKKKAGAKRKPSSKKKPRD